MSRLKQVLREAHQRSLWQALVVYLGASFAVLEAADLLIERFGLPGWLFPVAFALLVVGLPVVIVAALAKEEVYGDEVPEEHAAAAADEDRRLRVFTWRTAGLSFVGALALWGLVVAGLLLVGGYGLRAADQGLVRNRVVVAPFENRTGDSSLNSIGRIAADWIANGLAQLEAAEVVPTLDAVGSSGQVPEQVLARETRAGLLVAGSFYPRGDALEFEAHLVDTEREALLIAVEPVRGTESDTMAAIAELRGRIVGAVAHQLDLDIGAVQLPLTRPPSIEAYRAFLAAEAHVARVDWPGAEIDYRHAITLDTTFFLSYERLYAVLFNQQKWVEIDSLFRLVDRRVLDLSPLERSALDFWKAMHAGNRDLALSRARHLGERWTGGWRFGAGWQAFNNNRPREAIEWWDRMGASGGWGDWEPYWEFRAAAYHLLRDYTGELETARESHQRFGEAVSYLQLRALVGLGEVGQVERMLDVGFRPRRSLDIAQELRVHGYREAATRVADRLLEWYETEGPKTPDSGHRQRHAEALLLVGRSEEARALIRELASQRNADIHFRGLLGVAEAMSGNALEARRVAEELASMEGPYLWGKHLAWSARIEAVLGRRERAVAKLRRAFAQGLFHNWIRPREGGLSVWLHSEPEFESLRDYPPFQELLRPKG